MCYGITGRQRFLSHRDVMRALIRSLRRSRLPLRLSEGFHVRPKVTFALARGVGIASEAEWMEFELNDWVNPDLVRRQMTHELPEGFQLRSLRPVYPDQRAIVEELTYRIELTDGPVADLALRARGLLESGEIEVQRGQYPKQRQVNVRPLIRQLQVEPSGSLTLRAAASDEGTLRPEEILAALGLDEQQIATSLITRTEVVLADD